jgi:UDP-glucose 4-epimerase
MHVVNLRLAMVYGRGGRGNLTRLAHGLRAGWFPRLPVAGNRRSVVHVDDVVSAVRHVANHASANGRTFIVADSQAYSSKELCDAILAATGRPWLSWSAPEWGFRLGGRLGDGVSAITGRNLPFTSEIVSRLLDSECYSPARIERELGWHARTDLRMGLLEMFGPQGEHQ